MHGSDTLNLKILSVALIGPEEQRRRAIAHALVSGTEAKVAHELPFYPDVDDVPALLNKAYDVIIIDLDSDPEVALDLVENICSSSPTTVMVYSANKDPDILVRCMRAGAREFLAQPVAPGKLAEALVRASLRRPPVTQKKTSTGKLFVFTGAKGGSGVTTLASNFAVSLAKETQASTVLLDLGLPLGAAALDLGLVPQFSSISALQNAARLDSAFLSTLLVKHSSGLSVLCAPDDYTFVTVSDEALQRLLTVARQNFDYVVVDAGPGLGAAYRGLLEAASKVFLITQVAVSELRNSNRLIAEFFRPPSVPLEVILNRYTPKAVGIDEANIEKALTVPISWRVPSDYETVQRAQNTATAVALGESELAQTFRKIARSAAGLSAIPEKKKRFSLFG